MSQHARRTLGFGTAIVACLIVIVWSLPGARAARAQKPQDKKQAPVIGATMTRLADGRWLLVGGERSDGPVPLATITDQRDGTSIQLAGLQQARVGHTATLLADGSVLIAGGRGAAGATVSAELFDPATSAFRVIPMPVQPRYGQSATLLTDGRVLIAGGVGPDGAPLNEAEIWDPAHGAAAATLGNLAVARTGHRAELLGDGRVVFTGGTGSDGNGVREAELFDPATQQFVISPMPAIDQGPPQLTASIPENGAFDVALDTRIALRFSPPLSAGSVSAETVALSGPDGPVAATVVATENGRLAFVSPAASLAVDTTYVVKIENVVDQRGTPIAPTFVTITTVAPNRTAEMEAEAWTPSGKGDWTSNRPDPPTRSLPALQAGAGVTAVAGQVLRLDGRPLADVTLSMEGRITHTDRTGRFLLIVDGLTSGEHTLAIDGATASHGPRQYGFYEARVALNAGITNVLPFTIWSPLLDVAHEIPIASPTTRETVVTTPAMPGLELHLPAGTVIRDENGVVVRKVTMTPIPLDRTPFPLPLDASFSMYFTIQPGGAYIETPGPVKGAWLVYPKRTTHMVGARVQFYNYDPDDKGWFVYGLGTVTATAVVADAKTRFYAFTGASFNSGPTPPSGGQTPPGEKPKGKPADPVDPSTGAFIMEKTDLYLPDVMPLALTRVYNSFDNDPGNVRPFGIGMTHAYNLYQWSASNGTFQDGNLIQPDGGRIYYVPKSGSGLGTTFECRSAPTVFFKSLLSFSGNIWTYQLKDGTQYVMGHSAALQLIRDRYGNETRLTWSQTNAFGVGVGNIVRITSPNGRWIEFTYDTTFPVNRVTQAKDNLGRTVSYVYDNNGHLSTVTDPENNVTTYTWDANNRLATIKDGRNIVYLTNHYDANGRVDHQTPADPTASYSFAYTTDGNGNVTQTDITNPRGSVERIAYNPDHYATSDIEAVGQPEQRTTTYERQPTSNFITATVDDVIVDGLNRRTEFTYDDFGHVLTVKNLAGTQDAVTTTYTYEPKFFQLATIRDPLQHQWTIGYDAAGRVTSLTDPLTHQTSVSVNTLGQITSVTDSLQHTWQSAYVGGDQVSVTNPVGATWSRFVDGAGRVLSMTDPLGRVTRFVPDKINRITSVIDPFGGQTMLGYDANSRMISLADALTHTTSYTYDTSDREATRTDAVQKLSSYGYDKNDNLTQLTDRKGQVTSYQYDALDRLTLITYADASTTQFTYDAGDRLRQIVDSVGGTITRDYDGLDQLLSETTPEGSISYTYDLDGRRATTTVAGQAQVAYVYDDAHRLTSITQGTSVVSLTYDNANRRTTLTYPNGIIATFLYDNANQLTSLSYTLGQTTLGDLTYTYDAAGHRVGAGGSWARTGLPEPVASAIYDAANRTSQWAGQVFSHDASGNLASDGVNAYAWNARNQLTAISGGAAATFAYDGLARRRSKTINSTATNFLFDGVNLVQELAGSTPIANTLAGLRTDESFMRTDSSGVSTLLVDALGSTLAQADGSGNVQTQSIFEPFGTTSSSGATSSNPFQFTGRERDGTGLYYYRARYVATTFARFMSEDPIGLNGGDVDLYAYVGNDPVNSTDPFGLWHCVGGANCDFTPALKQALDCFDDCTGRDNAITGGRGPRHKPGSSHQAGRGCDIGRNNNPGLKRPDVERCFEKCFPPGSYGQEERNPPGTRGTHFHFQVPVEPGGPRHFAPGIQPYKP
jgi:RHS repeat-associated protein